jgi:hypothetical protein
LSGLVTRTWKSRKIVLIVESLSEPVTNATQQKISSQLVIGPAKSGNLMSLLKNMNARKKAGTSRSKDKSTISGKTYKDLKAGKMNKGGMATKKAKRK